MTVSIGVSDENATGVSRENECKNRLMPCRMPEAGIEAPQGACGVGHSTYFK